MAALNTGTGTAWHAGDHIASPAWAVLSLFNALAAMGFIVIGLALGNTAIIVAAMVVGGSGSILIDLLAKAIRQRRRNHRVAER